MRIEYGPLCGPVLCFGEFLAQLFTLGLELGPGRVEYLGQSGRTPGTPPGQLLTFLGGGFPLLGLDPTQGLDRSEVGLETCLGTRRSQIIR